MPLDRTLAVVRALIGLTRARVVALVALTAGPVLVAEGAPLGRVLAVLVGTGLLAAAASALNAVVDRDIDAVMTRTLGRPLPTGRIAPGPATAFGAILSVVALGILGSAAPLAALAGLATLFVYVVVYTLWLKRTSAWNMVVGAAPGAAAPLVADAADGALSAIGLAWFLLVFLWQPPHFWSIALFRREEYRAAGVPTLPDVVGEKWTRIASLGFAVALVPATLAPWWLGTVGAAYVAAALLVDGWLIAEAIGAIARGGGDRRVFFATLPHMGLLCGLAIAEGLW